MAAVSQPRITTVVYLFILIETLGLSKQASAQEIKQSYYRLAQQYHPDKNPKTNAAQLFAQVHEAYKVLGDPQQRAVYDQYVQDPQPETKHKTYHSTNNDFKREVFEEFDKFYQQRHNTAKKGHKGKDIFIELTLDFMESVNGCEQTVSFQREVKCGVCQGSGAEGNTRAKRCYTCGGSGQVHLRTGEKKECERCDGTGKVVKHKCHQCIGSGRQTHEDKQKINIPMGVNDQHILRIEKHGHIGTGNFTETKGDLIIRVTVQRDKYFRREGGNVVSDVYISIGQAVLGGEVMVDTLLGRQTIAIPAGTQPGSRIKLQAGGIKEPNKPRGHHFLEVQVMIPKGVEAEQEAVFRRLMLWSS